MDLSEKYIQFYIQHLYVSQKINGSGTFLMEDDLESSWSMENNMTVLSKFYPNIGFVSKNKYNLT